MIRTLNKLNFQMKRSCLVQQEAKAGINIQEEQAFKCISRVVNTKLKNE